ncbi:MAG: helix-turn-helix domain-containing protein [Leptolyngbya sp. SIO4C5]|uniref:helix-turn-helix domain-containing protein n=1 Tax=Sphaerothrix gracilis TaxID=3151835 RepID=UPI0013C0E419|nr:helix-turn-helix domain-containing protein [Leptolyngbya sp. SIO4C5]
MANLDSDQLEQLQEVGTYLRQVRHELSQSTEEIATRIFIRPSLLRAIEEADPDPLPEPVFIRGFIRRYGDALGLDGTELSKNFSVRTAMAYSTATAPPAAYIAKPLPPEPVATTTMDEPPAPPPSRRRSESPNPGPLLAIGAFVLVIIGAVVLLPNLLRSPTDAPEPPPEAVNPEPIDPVTPEPEVAPESADDAESAAPASTAPVSVSVDLSGDSWMRVIVDGQSQFEGLLSEGSQETWEGQQEITVTAGNAGAVALSVNGQEATPIGNLGQVETVTYTPDSGQ